MTNEPGRTGWIKKVEKQARAEDIGLLAAGFVGFFRCFKIFDEEWVLQWSEVVGKCGVILEAAPPGPIRRGSAPQAVRSTNKNVEHEYIQ